MLVKFIPKWCPAWWPALLCDPRDSLRPPGARASGSGVPTGRRATRRPASLVLAPTLPHTLSPAPASPRGTNARAGEAARARGLLSLSLRLGPRLGLCAQPAAGWSPLQPAGSRRPHYGHRVSQPRALPSQCRRHPYESGPGLHPLQPAGGDPPQRGRESAAPTARATVRLQRSVERCAERIRVGRPRRPLLYHGPAKGAPGTPAPGPCLIARPFGLRLRGRILPGPASRLPETNS